MPRNNERTLNTSINDSITQLEENLQCSVCLEVLTDPRTLACPHSFCKVCLEGVVEKCRSEAPRGPSRGQPIGEISCPKCVATFTLDPDESVADMPRNHFICNMVKVASVLKRGFRIPCSNCKQSYESVALAYCGHCQKFLGRECLKIHDSYRVTSVNIEHINPICDIVALETHPISQLEENLQCTVCQEVLTDPRTLLCWHSFCKVCLERLVEIRRGEALGQPIQEFSCPNCRTPFLLDPDEHVADMPQNQLICKMAQVAAELDRESSIPCSNCSEYHLVAHCSSCKKHLCQECLKIHESYQVTCINIEHNCAICSRDIIVKKTLDVCGHSFCASCIDEEFKHRRKCPRCLQDYGSLIGNQPLGKMTWRGHPESLPGYEPCNTIEITYDFEDGIQGSDHPNPGERYIGGRRSAYLPNNNKGRDVRRLLRQAFDQKLTFTIRPSATTEKKDCIVWKDIPHKTSRTGGPENNGYPDPEYLKKVKEVLAAKGIYSKL